MILNAVINLMPGFSTFRCQAASNFDPYMFPILFWSSMCHNLAIIGIGHMAKECRSNRNEYQILQIGKNQLKAEGDLEEETMAASN